MAGKSEQAKKSSISWDRISMTSYEAVWTLFLSLIWRNCSKYHEFHDFLVITSHRNTLFHSSKNPFKTWFLTPIPLLVSCCHVRSFTLTKDLTGLLQILSSDWLIRRERASAVDLWWSVWRKENGQNNNTFGQISNIFESWINLQLHNFMPKCFHKSLKTLKL